MLSLQKINGGYDGRPVIHEIDLEVKAGEIVALIGANGAGKSTLAKTLSGVLPELAGEITFQSRSLKALPTARRVQLGLVHVPEGRQVFAALTVEQNLELGAYAQSALSTDELKGRLEGIYARFPALRSRGHDVAGNLSGGQQQLLAIGRALMSDPKLLILDEPSLGLSPLMVKEVFVLIAALRDQGLAILLSEQNARMSLAIANRGYVMENGRITLSGNAAELAASEDIAARYLGLATQSGHGQAEAEFERRFLAAMGPS